MLSGAPPNTGTVSEGQSDYDGIQSWLCETTRTLRARPASVKEKYCHLAPVGPETHMRHSQSRYKCDRLRVRLLLCRRRRQTRMPCRTSVLLSWELRREPNHCLACLGRFRINTVCCSACTSGQDVRVVVHTTPGRARAPLVLFQGPNLPQLRPFIQMLVSPRLHALGNLTPFHSETEPHIHSLRQPFSVDLVRS
ncbi:hypothetical protein DFH07DRAFT_273056 [Mycena maculata]|uniref:Uncharacterized protein n=1 Tax=Mycena maculata TaxID=230809 RepID=A0AAD7JRG2_9AGAR|nr:hypothetical protein DFH07DRAFT_273056 [Mycena maculata]